MNISFPKVVSRHPLAKLVELIVSAIFSVTSFPFVILFVFGVCSAHILNALSKANATSSKVIVLIEEKVFKAKRRIGRPKGSKSKKKGHRKVK